MQEVVGIQYKTASKVYYFSPNGKEYKLGDRVLVDTANGQAVATITMESKMLEEDKLELPLKSVLRKLSDEDEKKVELLKQKATKAWPIVEEKIASLKLDMKIVDVEYSFDEAKVTIAYTSEGRVDFRELLKVLASALKTKIELRQIGTRDEVRVIGGLGLCGMECCCTRFLKEPEHVSVKMVKLQNLSMSPTKTGGLCGRMMCCLAYEDPVYKELAKNLPAVGDKIKTPDGIGRVEYNDLLKQKVTVKVTQKDDSYKIKEYNIEELGLTPNKNKVEENFGEEPNASEKQSESEKQIQKPQEQPKANEKDSEKAQPNNGAHKHKKHKFFNHNKKGEKK